MIKLGWEGIFYIKINGKEEIIHNRITDLALNELANALEGSGADIGLAYLALGTDNTPVSDSDTKLGNEIFRTQFQSVTVTDTGEVTSLAIVLESEAAAQIEEIGIFGGSSAGASADSGTLISRILWSRNKTNRDEIQFTRTDRIVRA
jgi:hypothetical protein